MNQPHLPQATSSWYGDSVGRGSAVDLQIQFGTAKHFFCSKCGIYTHHQRRSNPDQFGVNVACLLGVSPFDFEDVVVHDGVDHPDDAFSAKPRVAGRLKFIATCMVARVTSTYAD
jgi:hypothetical protein